MNLIEDALIVGTIAFAVILVLSAISEWALLLG